MTTTEKVVGGIIVVGAIGGLVYVLKNQAKTNAKTAIYTAIDEKTEFPAETTPAQIEAIVARKEQKAMFVTKAIVPLVLSSYTPSTTKINSFIKPRKPMVFEPMGGRPETGVISLGANQPVLSKGSKGKEVEALQKNLGFVTREFAKTARFKTPPSIIDGDFGQKTETALFIKYGVKSIKLSQLK